MHPILGNGLLVIGIARVGAVINPVNTMLTPNEIKYVVNDCKAKAIITSSEKVSQITDLKKGQINFIISFFGQLKDQYL